MSQRALALVDALLALPVVLMVYILTIPLRAR